MGKILAKFLGMEPEEFFNHLNESGELAKSAKHVKKIKIKNKNKNKNNKKIFFLKQFFALKRKKDRSTLNLKEIDEFLDKLNGSTKENEQYNIMEPILEKCTPDDIEIVCKLINKDLKINIGPKYVFEALHPDSFAAYKLSSDLEMIIRRIELFRKNPNMDAKDLFNFMTVFVPCKTDLF